MLMDERREYDQKNRMREDDQLRRLEALVEELQRRLAAKDQTILDLLTRFAG